MEIISNKEEMIFKIENTHGDFYNIGMSKKKQDGQYENGYMPVRFKKDIVLENKTKIKIKDAWLSFNIKDKKTYPYIFINEFDIVESGKEVANSGKKETNPFEEFGEHITTDFDTGHQIEIEDSELPF